MFTYHKDQHEYRITCSSCEHTFILNLTPQMEKAIAGFRCPVCRASLASSRVEVDRKDGPPDPRRQTPL